MFAGKAWAYPRVERLTKHSSLLRKFVNYGCKKFYDIGPRWEEGIIRVFDPYYDVTLAEIESVEGRKNADGRPVGQCSVALKTGDSIYGVFRQGVRQGRGALEGANCYKHGIVGLKGFYKDGVLNGEGRAILAPGAWAGVDR
jgi:hypothetical protein